MNNLLFLGTGPAGGTKTQIGKSKRLESSVLITASEGKLLIDVTQFFLEQRKYIPSFKAILITHAHYDAIGGIGELIKEFPNQVIPIYCLIKVQEKIERKFPEVKNHVEFISIFPYKKINLCGLSLTPIPVRHSLQKGYPTLGFFFKTDKNTTFFYGSDVASWTKKAEKFMRRSDQLIIDGAMWNVKMPAHLNIPEILPTLCAWENKKIIFTQIGNTAPEYEKLKGKIEKICSKAVGAYDGMRITI